MFGLNKLKENVLIKAESHTRDVVKQYHGWAKAYADSLLKEFASGYTATVAKQDKEIADLKATVQALREAHNELMAYDVSRRYRVTSPMTYFENKAGDTLRIIAPAAGETSVSRLARTHPKPEPIPVTPAKPARKRTK